MAGDYTRFTHRPEKRYSGVLMQQGRVQLDADSNEQVAIQKRRWEVQAFDTFCGCAVPSTTPDGFEVTVEGGDLKLGVGRIYVEGLLAEIFEGESWSYLKQPFLPDPSLLVPDGGQQVLVYLDVWDREVTWVQDRELLEKALQGPDTATRVQTVWQVKLTAGHCETDLDDAFPPSAGRLSSRPAVPAASDDPCIVSLAGGYRGLENRLYRVEIHDPGQAGDLSTVRFKWSRENASVISPVEAIDASGKELTVTRIGRDQVLRFKVGDWVELNDDRRELHGQAGEMAKVVAVDEANRKITLDRAMPSDFDAGDPGRHARLIRWDQNEQNSDGLIAASNAWILLEDGVEIRLALDPAGGRFHVGDYWAFAARTVDGSVEKLTAAPPRGIVHHYCALAALGEGASGVGLQLREDCRRIYHCGGGGEVPPRVEPGCCVVVKPGESIQAAIKALPKSGGCVCLKVGTHAITEPIRIASSNVVLRGESLGARVQRSNGVRALSIGNASSVAVRDLHFIVAGSREDGSEIISLRGCTRVNVVDCQLSADSAPGTPGTAPEAAGVNVERSSSVGIRGTEMTGITAGIIGADSDAVQVCDNQLFGVQQPFGNHVYMGFVGVATGESAAVPWRVEGNYIQGFDLGIWIGREAVRSLVASNIVVDPTIGVLSNAAGCVIQGNTIGLAEAGILVAPRGSGSPPSKESEPPDHSVVRGNTILRSSRGIIVGGNEGLDVEGVSVVENRVRDVERQAIALMYASAAVVASNRIHDSGLGITVSESRNLVVRANVIEGSNYEALAAWLFDSASVVDNSFSGAPHSPLVRVEVFGESLEKIIYSNNLCDHQWEGEGPATVNLVGRHQIVMGNHVTAQSRALPSIDFNNPDPVAVMGNITTGELVNVGTTKPPNYKNFNARV